MQHFDALVFMPTGGLSRAHERRGKNIVCTNYELERKNCQPAAANSSTKLATALARSVSLLAYTILPHPHSARFLTNHHRRHNEVRNVEHETSSFSSRIPCQHEKTMGLELARFTHCIWLKLSSLHQSDLIMIPMSNKFRMCMRNPTAAIHVFIYIFAACTVTTIIKIIKAGY